MSILIKSGEQYFEVPVQLLDSCGISSEAYELKRTDSPVAEEALVGADVVDQVQIGCGCCMDKKSLWASCQ